VWESVGKDVVKAPKEHGSVEWFLLGFDARSGLNFS